MSTRKLCRIALMAAMMVALKEALAWLPNGELVTSIVTIGTLVFGWEMLITTVVFSLIEILIYGLGLWTLMYLYIWNILVVLVMLLRKVIKDRKIGKHTLKTSVQWAAIESVYGLLFGTMCSIPYWFILGPGGAIAWIISGIPFDLMHCGWNFVFGLVTFDIFKSIFIASKKDAMYKD